MISTKKASRCVFSIIILKRSGVRSSELCRIYSTTNRPVFEYAAAVWHPGLTEEQSHLLESVQKGVFKVIFPNIDYHEAIDKSGLDYLYVRRDNLVQTVQENIFSICFI